MNTGAELVQYFCANTQLKTFNGGWTPLTHSGYTSALIHGVKEIQSSIWPAVSQLIITNDVWEGLCWYTALQQNFHRLEGSHMFNISGQNVNVVLGAPKNWHTFLYALTSSNIDRFSNLFHCLNQKNICNNTITKIPPHLKFVATLPFGLPVF